MKNEALLWLSSNPGKWVLTIAAIAAIAGIALAIEYFIDGRKG